MRCPECSFLRVASIGYKGTGSYNHKYLFCRGCRSLYRFNCIGSRKTALWKYDCNFFCEYLDLEKNQFKDIYQFLAGLEQLPKEMAHSYRGFDWRNPPSFIGKRQLTEGDCCLIWPLHINRMYGDVCFLLFSYNTYRKDSQFKMVRAQRELRLKKNKKGHEPHRLYLMTEPQPSFSPAQSCTLDEFLKKSVVPFSGNLYCQVNVKKLIQNYKNLTV